MIGKTLAHYTIREKLGSGGMGEVYRASDARLGRDVALKTLLPQGAADPARLQRFRQEAKVLAAMDHPNIVTVFSVDEDQDVHFLTMALVPGRTLDHFIPDGGMKPDAFFDVAIPVVDAVAAAHARGIVHRDLKPANIMITPEGRVKVLDFGLAKLLERPAPEKGKLGETTSRDATVPMLSRAGTASGTVPYMSPEQVEGRVVDAKTDIFSLGVLFYEMLSGRHPFAAETGPGTMAAILRSRPEPIVRHGIPGSLEGIYLGCLEKDPERRPEASRLLQRLRQIHKETPEAQESVMPSIAVLPFVDMSPEKDQDYFCDGIAEEILNSLSRLRGLRVSSRTTALMYRDARKDSRAIGREMGVSTLLEGSVRKAGDRLRVTVQLIDTRNDAHLWSGRYDRTLDDVFAIQEDIAGNVVQALKVTLTPGESEALRSPPTGNAQAYDFYLRGRTFFYRDTRSGHELAREMFKQAIDIDEGYVQAYAGLVDSTVYLYKHFNRDPRLLDEAEQACSRALKLNPDSAEAHTSRGVIHWLKAEHSDAEREFETAIRLDPTLFETRYHMGQWSLTRGRLEDAVRHFTSASELLPEDYQSPLILGSVYRGLGKGRESEKAYIRGLAVAREHLRGNPEDSRAWYLGAAALVALGKTDEGLEWAQKALAIDSENPLLLYNIASIYGAAGRIDQGVDMAEAAVGHGFTYRPAYENDPDLSPLRQHPRFKALVEGLGR